MEIIHGNEHNLIFLMREINSLGYCYLSHYSGELYTSNGLPGEIHSWSLRGHLFADFA